MNQQDATISAQQNPLPGAATSSWSCKWFGAIWLPLSKGNFQLQVTIGAGGSNSGVRVWIGQTQWGQQLLDLWPGGSGTHPFTVSAAALAGTLGYGGGTVVRDGWYPIRFEYSSGTGPGPYPAPTLQIVNSSAAYTDPARRTRRTGCG